MALTPSTDSASRDLALNAAFDILNNGKLGIFDSTQPATANTAQAAQVLLAELALGATAFNAASGGSKAAQSITQDSSANASGTATWASLYASARTTKGTMDMSAGVSGSTPNLVLNSAAISALAAVSCSSLTITQAA